MEALSTDSGYKGGMISFRALVVLTLVLMPLPVMAQSSLPNRSLTPGAINPAVTQANIQQTICVRGWTRTVRPPESFTYRLKRHQIREYGYHDRRLSHYEEDHLIPLDLGGAPADPQNLWPEPRHPRDGWTADKKNELEAVLVRLVCTGELPLNAARRAIARDWEQAYRRYVAP